ncbi:hypothetical protein H0H81_001408, partial [Sphagnurus paluster]
MTIIDKFQDLPTDFLSTPFGAALRPTIDAMYRRPTSNTPTPPIPAPSISTAPSAAPNPELAASILQAVAAQAQPGSLPIAATETLAAPLRVITNPPAFQSFLETHRAAVALFTSETCPPCRMIEPVFERLSEEKGVKSDGTGAGFAKIDISVGLGNSLASEWGIRATPTFLFFLDGRKLDELKGANANELRSQVDLLLFQAFPPHPHTSLSLPAVQAISLKPILFTQVPAIDAVLNKLSSFIDSTPWPSIPQTPAQVKQILSGIIAPYLKARFAPSPSANENLPSATPSILTPWAYATNTLGSSLPVSSLFPLVDLWRLALLDPSVGAWAASTPLSGPIPLFLEKASTALKTPGSTSNPRNYLLTVLRLLSNAFATPALAQSLFLTTRAALAEVVIPSLLHPDGAVRTAAASLAFNVAEFLQKGRVDKVKGSSSASVQEDEEWEVEMISAVVEALDRETTSEEVVHRLTASLAFLVRLSPVYETQVLPLLDVLQARAILKHKLSKGGCGEEGVTKRDVRKLVEEVAS